MIQSIENGRKEDGNRSIADKIIKRLHDLDKTVENNQGRWAWELLQNAKDSVAEYEGRNVSIRIELNEDKVNFKHNGPYFSERDIRGLINQISSKEVAEGEQTKKTGRFGTGFLTTHLLSKIIEVKGVVETQSNGIVSFEFPLDRQGRTIAELVPQIENAWAEFHNSAKPLVASYDESAYNTSFGYPLYSKEQKEIAKKGVEEFMRLIPFVLAFIPVIQHVEIIDNISGNHIIFENNQSLINDCILPIKKSENGIEKEILILYADSNRISIATEIERIKNGYSVKSIADIPKLFCDFPLIGTESFFFPVVVNSFFFSPQTERDGIWLKGKKDSVDQEVDDNQALLISAVDLLKELLDKISNDSFFDLYNIADTSLPATSEKYFDEVWYKNTIQKPLRDALFNTNLIEIENSESGKQSLKNMWFPMKSYSTAVKEKVWKFAFDLYPDAVPLKSQLHRWCDVSWDGWNKLSYAELVSDIVKQGNITALGESLKLDKNKTFDWLNDLYQFILAEESNLALFENNAIIPNQNGIFKKKGELHIDKIKDPDLIKILGLLGVDWKDILVHDYVSEGKYQVKEKKDIAILITAKLKTPLETDDYISAISLLTEWFDNNNPEQSKELFSDVYRKRAEFFMNTIKDKDSLYKVMRSGTDLAQLSKIAKTLAENPGLDGDILGAAELTKLLNDFGVESVDGLRELLAIAQGSHAKVKTEIDQDVLISLGVTSKEELEEALKDKDLAALYHTSTPNADLFLYVEKIINRAKANITAHLKQHPDYDCKEMEYLANTVIGGIKRKGLDIRVVIRPSDNGIVIVYYPAEKSTLAYDDEAELWIDNGVDEPSQLTLGKILKKTGINKIPV